MHFHRVKVFDIHRRLPALSNFSFVISVIIIFKLQVFSVTARSYINEIADEKAGLLHMVEDTVYTEEDEIEELEFRLETLFDLDEFDSRHKAYDECLAKLAQAEIEIEGLKDDLGKANVNLKRTKKKHDTEISDLEVHLCLAQSNYEEMKRKLQKTEKELISAKADLGMVLEDWSIWKFVAHRIDFPFCNLLKKLAKILYEEDVKMSNTYEIPYSNKYTLSIEEAAGYFRIGECKLRKIITEDPTADFILWNGNRMQIKRKKFEKFIDRQGAI